MRIHVRGNRVVVAAGATLAAVFLWLCASIPTGFPISQISMFAGPGIVLAVAANWASHAANPSRLTWRHGFRAAVLGAVLFPPLIAFYFAWGGSFGTGVFMTLLIFSTWLALMAGLIVATLRMLSAPERARRRAQSPRAPHPYEIYESPGPHAHPHPHPHPHARIIS